MHRYLFFLVIFCTSASLKAQNFYYGKASQEEVDMKAYDKDTSAHAVILNEYGKAEINGSYNGNVRLIYEYHVKIKIFDAKAFQDGTIVLHLRNNENNTLGDEINNLSGTTTYKDDNGVTQIAELDPKNIYKTRVNKYENTWKFAMPDLRKGCVIEYRYILISPFFDHFHSWAFQGNIPKVHTSYDATIPGFWTYNVTIRGPLKLSKSQSGIDHNCFSSNGASCDCLKLAYEMNDVPAFIAEEFMTSPRNYLSVLNFDLIEYTNLYTGVKTKITKEWKDVDNTLRDNPDFGEQLKKKNMVKDHIPPAILSISNNTQKAKAIYRWVQNWFKWNDLIGIYSNDGIKKAIEAHKGNVADINLTLVDALNAAGINTEAVLLSTREHGVINRLYPVIGDFNYVIARITIDDKSWFLDATDPLLPFGILPVKCLNDQGRAFSLDKPSYWIDLDTKQHILNTLTIDLTMQEDGKLRGKFNDYSQGYDAYIKRKEIKKFNSVDEYVENLAGRWGRTKILKSNVINIDSLDSPINEEYEIEIDLKNSSAHDRFAFNPYIFDKKTVNPFKLTDRNYPVDMGMPSEDRYILTLHLPDRYIIETALQNQSLSLSEKDALFTTQFDKNSNIYTFSSLISINHAIFPAGEYPYLKEFFNKIILAEKEDIIFKKK